MLPGLCINRAELIALAVAAGTERFVDFHQARLRLLGLTCHRNLTDPLTATTQKRLSGSSQFVAGSAHVPCLECCGFVAILVVPAGNGKRRGKRTLAHKYSQRGWVV